MNAYGSRDLLRSIKGCGALDLAGQCRSVQQQIIDFLEGRTHGSELLHALHDHVLDEPIPERMLALFRAGSAD
jgi:hypothetical protein